jgi:hypothetical protein
MFRRNDKKRRKYTTPEFDLSQFSGPGAMSIEELLSLDQSVPPPAPARPVMRLPEMLVSAQSHNQRPGTLDAVADLSASNPDLLQQRLHDLAQSVQREPLPPYEYTPRSESWTPAPAVAESPVPSPEQPLRRVAMARVNAARPSVQAIQMPGIDFTQPEEPLPFGQIDPYAAALKAVEARLARIGQGTALASAAPYGPPIKAPLSPM